MVAISEKCRVGIFASAQRRISENVGGRHRHRPSFYAVSVLHNIHGDGTGELPGPFGSLAKGGPYGVGPLFYDCACGNFVSQHSKSARIPYNR